MKDQDAIAEFERWFASIESEEQRAGELQRLAKLAKTEPDKARHLLRQLDRQPRVYDAANLYPAVRHAWRRLKALKETPMIAIYIYIADVQAPDIRYAWEVRNGDEILKRGAARSAAQAAAQADQWLDINGYRRMK